MGKVTPPYFRVQDGKLYIQGDFYQSSVNGVSNNGRYEIRLNGILMDTVPVAKNYAEQYFDRVKNLPSNNSLLLNGVNIDVENATELYYFCFMKNAYYTSDQGNPLYPDKLAVAVRDDVGSITLSQSISSVGNFDKNGINIVYRNTVRQGSSYKLNAYSTTGSNIALSQFVICPNVIVDLSKYAAGTITITPVTDHEHPEFEYTIASFPYDDQELDITLYQNSAEPIVVDKTNQLVFVDRLRGKFRSATDLLNPTIEINRANGFRVGNFNYVYIAKFNRYYYVSNITSVRSNLWSISLNVDVLMSYKNKIIEQIALIARNEFDYNDFLVDDNVPSPMRFNPFITIYSNFKTVINGYTHIWEMNDAKNLMVCLSKIDTNVSGNYDYSFSPTISRLTTVYYFDNENDFNNYLQQTLSPSWWESTGDRYQNHAEYVVGNYVIPFDLVKAVNDFNCSVGDPNPMGLLSKGSIQVGNALIEGDIAYIVSGFNRIKMWSTINYDTSNDISFNSFLDTNPYSRYYLYLPFYGVVEISSERIERGLYKYIVYDVDVVTGDFVATLSNHEPTFLEPSIFSLDSWRGNMYVQLPNGYTNQAELHRNATLLASNYATSLINNVAELGFGLSKGVSKRTKKKNQISKKGKAIISKSLQDFGTSMFADTSSMLTSVITDFVPSGHCDGIPDSILNFKLGVTPWIIKVQPEYYYPDNYNHFFGRPLMDTRQLSNIHGYTVISDIHLIGFDDVTITELDDIETLLLTGVILP